MFTPVMAGLVPAIHVLRTPNRGIVDARHEAGHDGVEASGRIRGRDRRIGFQRMLRNILFAVTVALSLAAPALAVQPDEMLKDPAQEQRARDISQHLRCLVCQNQSIDDSDAGLARDLRLLVRERIKEGDSNSQVIDYLVARYGEFVLLKPRFSWHTAILWIAPALILLAGVVGLVIALRRRREVSPAVAAAAPPLSDEEKRKLAELTKG